MKVDNYSRKKLRDLIDTWCDNADEASYILNVTVTQYDFFMRDWDMCTHDKRPPLIKYLLIANEINNLLKHDMITQQRAQDLHATMKDLEGFGMLEIMLSELRKQRLGL